MALHPAKEEALLAWINGLQLDEPVQRLAHLQDGMLLLRFVHKLKGEEPSQAPVHLPQAERLSIISDFLHSVCHGEECAVLTLAKGRMLELELTKVVLLLCYHGLLNNSLVPKVDYDTELQLAAMLRYVQLGVSGLSMGDGLDKILTTSSLTHTSSVSSTSSFSDGGSPIFPRTCHSPLVNFVELDTVASSSFNGSPLQELMSTPQVQVKRLRKELAREGDVRDELERELAERIGLLSEKEGQVSQLQHRLQRLQRDQEEMEKEHKATLTELQQKNEGLLTRVHEVLKQCRDLKTDNGQKERRLDELLEENGALASQVRNTFTQLTRAEEEIAKLTEAHSSSQTEWGSRRDLLQRELSQALTDRESLSEQIQILQGKISVLEDELAKLLQQPQEKGEVLGPIVEHEKLQQEVAALTLKLSQLKETISLLEKEKTSVETMLAEERITFKKETLRLEGRISDLQQSINNMQVEKDAQEQASRTQQETLALKIAALETDLAHLQQLEGQLTAEIATSAELRQQRGMLEAKVTSLEGMVQSLQSKCQNMEVKNATQQEVLNAVRADLQCAQISLEEYEKKLADHQKVVEENASLRARISALDDTIANLQTEIDAERKRGDELLAANEHQKALMEERFEKQEQKAHEMLAELETLSQELRKLKHQKLNAESCIEKLTQEGVDLKATLAQERDHNQTQLVLVNKGKEESKLELQQIITDNQSKISALQRKIEGTVESLKQSESEMSVLRLKIISKDGELGKQQQELAHLQNKADDLQRQLLAVEGLSQQLSEHVVFKDKEVQHLKVALEQKEGEIQSLKVNLQSLEVKSGEMSDLHQKEVEKQSLAIVELKLQLKASKEAHEAQEQTLRLEITKLQQEIDGHLKKLEESLNEVNFLKGEMSHQQDVALQKDREFSVLAAKNKSLEENFAELQSKLAEATTLAADRQTELLNLQEEVQHQENLRAKAQKIEETQLQKEAAELQARVQELTSLASEREIQLCSLHEKMKEQENYSQKILKISEEAFQKELENVVDLKGQLESAKHHTAATNELLASTEEKLKQVELMYQQKDTLASETCQANEALERTINELCSERKQDLDRYQQDLETLKKEKEHLTSVNKSLQNECQTWQVEGKEQQETLNAFKADLQSTKSRYEQDLEALKKEKEHLQDECRRLQTENKGQHEVIDNLKADLKNTQIGYQQEVETLKKEQEHLSSVNQSLQTECQNVEAENKKQQKELNVLKVDLQNAQEVYQQELSTLKKEKDHLTSMHQAVEVECQNLKTESKIKLEELNVLKVDLQNTRKECQQEMDSLKNEKEHLSSVTQSVKIKCQTLQAEKTKQQDELNTLKADLQETKDKYQKDLESLMNEKEELALNETEQLALVSQSLRNECENLQAVKTGQEQELNALKADLQENKNEYEKALETLKNEKKQLTLVNQDLLAEKMGQQEELNALMADLQENKDKSIQDVETLKNEKEQLALENQSLIVDLEAAKKVGSELTSVKDVAQQRQNELKDQVKELQAKIKEFSTFADEREAEIKNLHLELQQQEASRLSVEDSEKALRAELETKVAQLQVQVEEVCKLASESNSELSLLQDQYKESEKRKQEACQANEMLENTVSELRLKLKQELEEYHQQLEALAKEKDALATVNQTLRAKKKTQQEILDDLQSGLQQGVKTLSKEKEHLSSVNQSLQREWDASRRLGAELEAKLEGRAESFRAMKEAIQKKEQQNQELLKLKTDAVEHYKVQVEKAKTHYNGKKQQLLEEQEARQTLQASLETSESEAKALKAELKLVSMELGKIKASEKRLMVQIKSLETQLDYAAHQLREQRKQEGPSVQMKRRESACLKIPENPRNTSSDSLEFDLDYSLNAAGKRSVPGQQESSTPLVRSSERLAAKRRAQDGGSLETLYFTPMMPQGKKRSGASQDHKLESSITSFGELTLDSAKKPSSSVRRRRTTQVINITMTKKTPLGSGGAADVDESFFSLHSASSQPNLASLKARPVSAEIFEDSSKLLSLPGYRRSNAHAGTLPRATSAFCIGEENEPDHISDDWMRIAELQSRNKSCLPHLKSSYPLESRPSLGFSHLPVTDEDVRTGDPTETIRRVSMIPSQLKDVAHRLSLAPPAAASHGRAPSQRVAQVAKARDVRSTRSPLALKRPAGQVQDSDTPEVKKPVSCFPRTPKGRNLRATNSQNAAPSPADRKRCMTFMIDNTPKKPGRGDSRLQRGINKLRRSPRTTSTKSPKITSSAKKLMKFRMKI